MSKRVQWVIVKLPAEEWDCFDSRREAVATYEHPDHYDSDPVFAVAKVTTETLPKRGKRKKR